MFGGVDSFMGTQLKVSKLCKHKILTDVVQLHFFPVERWRSIQGMTFLPAVRTARNKGTDSADVVCSFLVEGLW